RDRQGRGLGTLEDAADIDADLAIHVDETAAVAHKPARLDRFTRGVAGGAGIVGGQPNPLDTPGAEKTIRSQKKRNGPVTHEGWEGRIDLAAGAGIVDLKLQSESAGGRFYVCQHGRCIRRVSRIDQYRDAGCRRQQLTQQSQPLSIDLRTE